MYFKRIGNLTIEQLERLAYNNWMRVSEEYMEEPDKERRKELWELALSYSKRHEEYRRRIDRDREIVYKSG